MSLGLLHKKIDLGEWLGSLFLVNDVSHDRPDASARKGKLIAMPPVAYRATKEKLGPRAVNELSKTR